MATWQVHAARNHLSEVLDQAESDGPQTITHHGRARAVVLAIEEYQLLKSNQKPDFITFLLTGPKVDWEEADLERDRSTGREIGL